MPDPPFRFFEGLVPRLPILGPEIPYVAQLAKMASVCRLCGSSVAYSHHRVALFGKKASQERLASRISALLDITFERIER